MKGRIPDLKTEGNTAGLTVQKYFETVSDWFFWWNGQTMQMGKSHFTCLNIFISKL